MAVALYESVQENRAATQAVSVQIDRLGIDLQASISSMVRESSSASLREACVSVPIRAAYSANSRTGYGCSRKRSMLPDLRRRVKGSQQARSRRLSISACLCPSPLQRCRMHDRTGSSTRWRAPRSGRSASSSIRVTSREMTKCAATSRHAMVVKSPRLALLATLPTLPSDRLLLLRSALSAPTAFR